MQLGRAVVTALLWTLVSAPSYAEGASKQAWLQRMKTTLPTKMCAEQQYFRQCFDVDARQCERTMASATRSCVREFESDIPDTLDRDAGRRWGKRLGQCAGGTYETSLTGQRIDDERCNNIDNWR
jgi:hypothetical protein